MTPGRRETLWELGRGERLRYGGAILAMALSNGFLFAIPLVSKRAIDGLGTGGAGAPDVVRLLAQSGALVVACTAAAGALLYLRGRWAAGASEGIVRRLRDRLFGHLQALPCAWLDRADTGDVVQRCTSDVETIRVFLASQVVEVGRAALLLVTVVPVLWSLDRRMTLVTVALFPGIVTFAVLFFRRVQRRFRDADEAEGAMTTVLQENLAGIRVVRAFARQEHECARFGAANAEYRDRTAGLIGLLGTYWALSDLLCIGQVCLVLAVGARGVAHGTLSVGTMFAFLLYVNLVLWPVRQLGRVLSDAGKALVALDRLGEILSVPEEDAGDGEVRREDGPWAGAIEVDGLTFAYGDDAPALRDVSFRAEPGETVALVGPPGCGKSTLVAILLRLYDYREGTVRIDGRELRDLDRKLVRSRVGTVLQEPFLWAKTIDANVRVGRDDATPEEIVESTTAACVHDTILAFEHGYETLLGERGVTLSGGQRQRVAIARAVLRDPPILVLDDALSAVDTRTEARILEALRSRRGRRTTLVVAHRLSSVREADRVLVLERGRVVQWGRPEELARTDGPYRRLWRIQGALEDEIERDLAPAGGES